MCACWYCEPSWLVASANAGERGALFVGGRCVTWAYIPCALYHTIPGDTAEQPQIPVGGNG